MSLQVSLKLKLIKQNKVIQVKYNTFEKATFDEYLATSLALRAKDEESANKYIDDITGSGSLNAHFKNLYEKAKELTEDQLNDVLKNSLYPILKIDNSNRYDYYPELDVSVYNNKIYKGDFGTYKDLMEKIYMQEKVIDYNVSLNKEYTKPEPYQLLFEDKKLQVKINNEWIPITKKDFSDLYVNELDKISIYQGKIHKGVDGFGWNTLSNSTISNMYSNKNFFYDNDGNHCQIRNDNIRKTIVSEIYGLYIYKEEIIPYERNTELCNKVLDILYTNKGLNEFKTKSLLVILDYAEELKAQEVINYILTRKDSKEISQFGIKLLKNGLEKNWDNETLKSFMTYAERDEITMIYKANTRLRYDINTLIFVNKDDLSKSDLEKVEQYYNDLNAKKNTIKSIIGDVTSSALRENVKLLKANDDTKRFTKLANELIGHNKINVDNANINEIENILKKALEMKELQTKLQKEIDKKK